MKQTIYLAGGCFWGVQKFFDQFRGVLETEVGYANGLMENPSYDDLHDSGHAETVMVAYDDSIISLDRLLDYFFMIIDPTSLNRQGMDIGKQYRTGIYYTDDAQLPAIKKSLAELRKHYDKPIVVEVEALQNYFTAERGHQKYLDMIPWGYCHINRNMFKLQEQMDKEGEDGNI